jgi:hypothetical protein
MASQIFPHNTEVDMGSKIQFSGIDWKSVEKNMKSQRFAMDNTDDIMEAIARLTGTSPEQVEQVLSEIVPDETHEVSDGEAEAIPHGFVHGDDETEGEEDFDEEPKDGMHDDETEDAHVGYGEEEDHHEPMEQIDGGMSHKIAKTNKMTKIAFTSPDQISAAAIEAAIAKGDQKLVNTILAARKENRIRIAKAIESKMKKEAAAQKAQTKVAQNGLPGGDLSGGSSAPIDFMGTQGDTTSASGNPYVQGTPEYNAFEAGKNSVASMGSADKFASPSEFTKAQRLAFTVAARKQGFPEEYINAMVPPDPKVADLNAKIKEVYSSSLSSQVKETAVKSLIKEAKLSQESKSEFIDYWNNVLGYQDKDFWPAVAADYDAGKKVN